MALFILAISTFRHQFSSHCSLTIFFRLLTGYSGSGSSLLWTKQLQISVADCGLEGVTSSSKYIYDQNFEQTKKSPNSQRSIETHQITVQYSDICINRFVLIRYHSLYRSILVYCSMIKSALRSLRILRGKENDQFSIQIILPETGDPKSNSHLLLSDVTHRSLMKSISGSLKLIYLGPYVNDSTTASGIIYGPHARPIISLPVAPLIKKEGVAIHFLIDTAVPNTYLSQEALKAIFGIQDLANIESTNVNIWGVKHAVGKSAQQWQGINLLGADFLRKANLTFECNYDQDPQKETCLLRKKQKTDVDLCI